MDIIREKAVGERFVAALSTKDRDALLALFAPEVRMWGLANGRQWKSRDAVEVVDDILLGDFFGPTTDIDEVSWARYGEVVDRVSASYFLRMSQGEQRLECEQHCFFEMEGDRIYRMHLICSGFVSSPAQKPVQSAAEKLAQSPS